MTGLAGESRMSKSKTRTYRVFTCKKCAKKHGWALRDLFEVGFGQCNFCGVVSRDLRETPLLVCETKAKKKKAS